ncbi:cation transporter, partial [Xanthomonas perforans]|uniref:cation transporter n=1 Tax=Xanthomonas perforans TaxID=442694 RepID=UPI00069F5B1E
AGWIAHSTGLLADALDMLSDATAYAIGLVAIGRTARFKANAAWVSGSVLLVLGVGVLVEVGRPVSGWMIGTALVSLAVNLKVLRMLAPLKSGEVHLRATWLFTRADVVANVGVILAGLLVWWLASPYPDFVIGALIGLYVIKEAFEILGDARRARADARNLPP